METGIALAFNAAPTAYVAYQGGPKELWNASGRVFKVLLVGCAIPVAVCGIGALEGSVHVIAHAALSKMRGSEEHWEQACVDANRVKGLAKATLNPLAGWTVIGAEITKYANGASIATIDDQDYRTPNLIDDYYVFYGTYHTLRLTSTGVAEGSKALGRFTWNYPIHYTAKSLKAGYDVLDAFGVVYVVRTGAGWAGGMINAGLGAALRLVN